jgi:diacylglycerol kinase family enzyme
LPAVPKTLVLINARAGTLVDSGTDNIVSALESVLGRRETEIRLLKPRAMVPAIAEAARGVHDTVIVGGGDGSVSCAAAALAGSEKVLGVLPFGTLNLLARDLGMPSDPKEAVAALASAKLRRIDLARVADRPFHSLSGLGFFSQMARAREEVRGHPLGRFLGVAVAALRAVRRTATFTLDISADGRHSSAEALAVLITNNRFGPDWRRKRLDEGVLEILIAENAGGLAKLKASADLVTGGWRESEGIRSIIAREVTISRHRRQVWAATDGELSRKPIPLRYHVMPKALNTLAVEEKS